MKDEFDFDMDFNFDIKLSDIIKELWICLKQHLVNMVKKK